MSKHSKHIFTPNASRRDFLRFTAKTGALLPFTNLLLGHRALAAGTFKRVIFFYYPNGIVAPQWQPDVSTLSLGQAASLSLDPLKDHHDKLSICKNMFITGSPAGGHDEASQNCMAGKAGIADHEATADHIIAEAIGSDVVNLGVRTGNASDHMISKPRGHGNKSRPVPNNDPKDAADKLFAGLDENPDSAANSAARHQMLDTILADLNELKSLALSGAGATKVEQHEISINKLKDQIERTFADCNISKTQVSDPYHAGAQGADYVHWQVIPEVARAQIDNAVGALACGVSKVATVQMMRGGENPALANYCFDECWEHIQIASEAMGSSPTKRWFNEHASHTASHAEFRSHTGQNRWYASLFAYLLDQLSAHSIFEDTIAVMLSEVGDGNAHGPESGGVIVGGGTGDLLPLGKVIDCANSRSTQQLFVDIGTLLGVDLKGENGWFGGGAII